MNLDELRALAQRRHELHEEHESSRPLSADYELVGLLGEAEFARRSGLELDTRERRGGDGGIDFTFLYNGRPYSVDVKTARKAYHLLVEVGHVHADYYVLARVVEFVDGEPEGAELLGYARREDIIKAPTRDFGYGIVNYYIPAARLRSLEPMLAAIVNYGKVA